MADKNTFAHERHHEGRAPASTEKARKEENEAGRESRKKRDFSPLVLFARGNVSKTKRIYF